MFAAAVLVVFAAPALWRVIAKMAIRAAILAMDLAAIPFRLGLWVLRLRSLSPRRNA